MPAERVKEIPPHVIYGATVEHLTEDLVDQAAGIYFLGWRKRKLCGSFAEAREKMRRFMAGTYAVVSEKRVLAAISTLPVAAGGTDELFARFPTYKSIEDAAGEQTTDPNLIPANPTHIICFSIIAREWENNRIAADGNPKGISVPQFLVDTLKQRTSAWIVPWSRFDNVPAGKTPMQYYQENIHNQRIFGAPSMHKKFGEAQIIGIVNDSRSEDTLGGGANVVLVYPRNSVERAVFDGVREKRGEGIFVYQEIGNAVVFSDIP